MLDTRPPIQLGGRFPKLVCFEKRTFKVNVNTPPPNRNGLSVATQRAPEAARHQPYHEANKRLDINVDAKHHCPAHDTTTIATTLVTC